MNQAMVLDASRSRKLLALRQQTRERTIGKRHIAQICADLRRYVWVFTGKIGNYGNLQYIYKNMTRNHKNFEEINNHVVIMDTAKLRSLESRGNPLETASSVSGPVIPGRCPRDWCRSRAKIIKDLKIL